MADLKYTRRASGGKWKDRKAPSDKQVTTKEQRVIDFLRQQQQDTKEVRTDFLRSTEGVMKNEAENRQTLQTLKNQLWEAKKNNVKKRQQTEVDYYEGLASQAAEREEFWRQYTPTLAKDLENITAGLRDTVQYWRDKRVLDRNKKREEDQRRAEEDGRIEREEDEWGPGGQPPGDYDPDIHGDYDTGGSYGTDKLQIKALNTTIGESHKEQARLHDEGNFTAAEELNRQVWGQSAGTVLWGTHFGRKQVANFDQEWPSIVALAFENVPPEKQGEDLIEASYFKYLEHKGVALDSIAGKEVTKKFRKKLTAFSVNKLQETLVADSERKSLDIQDSVRTAIKNNKGLEGAITQLVLHESRAHKMINGKYSAPAMRQINYGQTFDSIVEPLLKLYEWSSWEEFDRKILSLPVIANKTNYHLPVNHPKYLERPTWRKQREHMIDSYKDLFIKTFDKEVKRKRGLEKADIVARIANLEARTTDKNSTDAEGKPNYIDVKSEDGRKELWSLLKSAESEDEKKWIGAKLLYDPKSNVEHITHELMLQALNAGDATEFQWHFNGLKDYQKKYYKDLNQFTSRQELIKANWTYKDTEKFIEELVKARLDSNWSVDSNFRTYTEAKKLGIQRFYDINDSIDKELTPEQRIDKVKKDFKVDFDDENGLFKTETIDNRNEFVHLMPDYKYGEPGLYVDRVLEKFDSTTTINEVNKLDLIPEEASINMMKDISKGLDGVRMPKIFWDIHKKTGIPLVDIANGQLTRETIKDRYDYSVTEKDLLKATQIEYFERKAPEYIVKTTSPQNVPAVSAWYDLKNLFETLSPQQQFQGLLEKGLDQLLLPINLNKYNENRDQSSLDSIDVPYEITDGRTRFSDPELAIRRGQEEGLVYNPLTDTMMEVS